MTMYEFIEASIYIWLAWTLFSGLAFIIIVDRRNKNFISKFIKNKFKEWFNVFTR